MSSENQLTIDIEKLGEAVARHMPPVVRDYS